MNIYTMVKKARNEYLKAFFKGYYGTNKIRLQICNRMKESYITVSCADMPNMRYCFIFRYSADQVAEQFKNQNLNDKEMKAAIKEFFMNNVSRFYELRRKGLRAS